MESIHNDFEKYCIDANYDKIKKYLLLFQNMDLPNYNNGEYFEIIVDSGNLELIKLFIDYGVDVNINNNYALYTCALRKYDKCLEYLLSHGSDIKNIKSFCGSTYLSQFINRED